MSASTPAAATLAVNEESASATLPLAWLATCELLLVALLWGVTNPWINRATKAKANPAARTERSETGAAASSRNAPTPGLTSLLLNWRFLLPFGLNQLGSVIYLHCLSRLSLSFAVPTVNALTMIITAVAATKLGERTKWNARIIAGMTMMLVGVCLCIISQHKD